MARKKNDIEIYSSQDEGKSVVMKTMSSLHIDKKEKDTFILGVEPTQGLDDTALAAEAIHVINFTHPKIWITSMETIASYLLMLEK